MLVAVIGTLHWSDCVHVSGVARELAAFVLAPLVHSTSRPVSPNQGLINTVSLYNSHRFTNMNITGV